jgi:hypothetical protein
MMLWKRRRPIIPQIEIPMIGGMAGRPEGFFKESGLFLDIATVTKLFIHAGGWPIVGDGLTPRCTGTKSYQSYIVASGSHPITFLVLFLLFLLFCKKV